MLFHKIKNYKTFFLEIIAVFIGITASFWVENYREDLQEEKIRKDQLQKLYYNLDLDSMRVIVTSDILSRNVRFFEGAREELKNKTYTDSTLSSLMIMFRHHFTYVITKFGYDRLVNSSVDDELPVELLKEIDEYYVIFNHLFAERNIEFGKKAAEERNEYLNKKGVIIGYDIRNFGGYTEEMTSNIPEYMRDNINATIQDKEFLTRLDLLIQIEKIWQNGIERIYNRSSLLKRSLRAYYREKYGGNILDDIKLDSAHNNNN